MVLGVALVVLVIAVLSGPYRWPWPAALGEADLAQHRGRKGR